MLSSLGPQVFLLVLLTSQSVRACDPVFEDCSGVGEVEAPEECDEVFQEAGCGAGLEDEDCYSITDVDSDIFTPDTRQAVKVCGLGDCSQYADRGYACAPLWTCKENRIITDGKGIIDVRTSLEEEELGCSRNSGTIDLSDKKCPKVDEVCCKKPNYRAKQCDPVNQAPPQNLTRAEWGSCGRNGSGRLLLSGSDDPSLAQPGEFPHMCVIYRIQSGQRVYLAGASLIAPNKLLTVAHKFWVVNKGKTTDHRPIIGPGQSQFYARCGEHNVKADNELLEPQETKVVAIRIHPDYNSKGVTYNLAILITEDNFVYQEHIGPVCLPQPGENFEGQTECWSSGWGADAYDSQGFFSDTLKKVKMPIVARGECEAKLRAHERFRGKNFRLHQSWLCVGGEKDSDTCKGDGGSPHVCINKDNRYVQVGSVAWGVGCGNEIPSVYSKTAGSMCWIDWIMSCVPLSDYNIDDSGQFLGELRDTENGVFKSAGGLTVEQCGTWLENKPKLKQECSVLYEIIDNRSTS